MLLQGWVPGRAGGRSWAACSASTTAHGRRQSPREDEYPEVPVKLKNNRFTRALNMVTEMYSLPAYNRRGSRTRSWRRFSYCSTASCSRTWATVVLMIIAAVVVLAKAKAAQGHAQFLRAHALVRHFDYNLGRCHRRLLLRRAASDSPHNQPGHHVAGTARTFHPAERHDNDTYRRHVPGLCTDYHRHGQSALL